MRMRVKMRMRMRMRRRTRGRMGVTATKMKMKMRMKMAMRGTRMRWRRTRRGRRGGGGRRGRRRGKRSCCLGRIASPSPSTPSPFLAIAPSGQKSRNCCGDGYTWSPSEPRASWGRTSAAIAIRFERDSGTPRSHCQARTHNAPGACHNMHAGSVPPIARQHGPAWSGVGILHLFTRWLLSRRG